MSGDRFGFTTIAHAGRRVLAPLSLESLDRLLSALPAPAAGLRPAVLDVGCGKGELLLRSMERRGATGLGVEPNPVFAAATRAAAIGRVPPADLAVIETDARQAALPANRFDLLLCTGATHAFGGDAGALRALAVLARPRAHAIVGTGYWRREPDPAYLAVLGAAPGEMQSLAATLELPAATGWRLLKHHASTDVEWDDYEAAYAAAMNGWLAANPGHADAPAWRARIERWTAARERWGRSTMGFVTLVLALD